jgi:hypothetical protein
MEMTELKASEVQEWSRPVVTLAEAATGRHPCLTWGNCKASFWVMAEEESPSEFQLCVLSRFPYPYPEDYTSEKYPRIIPQHCVDIEIEDVGLEEFLDITQWPRNEEGLATWLMQEGLAPGQAFRLMAEVNYTSTTSMEWIGVEYDMEVDWEIVDREYIEPEEAARRWKAYADDFKRVRFCEFTGDRDHDFDEVGYKKVCEHIGFVPAKADQSLCLKHNKSIQVSSEGWRVCCQECVTPVQAVKE